MGARLDPKGLAGACHDRLAADLEADRSLEDLERYGARVQRIRELEMLGYVARRLSNAEIAKQAGEAAP